MRRLIISALVAATVLPAAPAMAQSWGEVRRDRQELREERRELRDARRYGDRGDVRRERRDVREARRELREDRRDWREHRRYNRDVYRRGNWSSPYRYRTWDRGVRIPSGYYSQRYWISDPYRYRLPRAHYGTRWVRHYDDVLLIDTRSGVVVDVIRNFYW